MWHGKRSHENLWAAPFSAVPVPISKYFKMSSLLDKCGVCGTTANLQRCSRCQHIVYCSKEHQIAHWKTHRKQCTPSSPHGPGTSSHSPNSHSAVRTSSNSIMRNNGCPSATSSELSFNASSGTSSALRSHEIQRSPDMPVSSSSRSSSSTNTNGMSLSDNFSKEDESMEAKKTSNKRGSKKNKAVKVNNNNNCSSSTSLQFGKRDEDNLENHAPSLSPSPSPPTNMSTLSLNSMTTAPPSVPSNSGLTSVIHPNPNSKASPASMYSQFSNTPDTIKAPPETYNYSKAFPFLHRNADPTTVQHEHGSLWVLKICQQVITDMDKFGVCVVDNLLGEERGVSVFEEVQSLYTSGLFEDGQLVKEQKDGSSASQNIRGDKITWVDGKEPTCGNINFLISLVDSIVISANKVKNNGKLGSYTIKNRTKAMVACYPGSGTHYVKHVDNPNRDGRCITAIYYLNKDWDTKEHGGLLRIFPEGWPNQVADIEPLFDRVLFFWSDRRNPHEVQPAFRTRYAITLWYFDATEREEASGRGRDQIQVPLKA